jgi:hypothetical protein
MLSAPLPERLKREPHMLGTLGRGDVLLLFALSSRWPGY